MRYEDYYFPKRQFKLFTCNSLFHLVYLVFSTRLVASMFGVAGSFFELKFSGDLKCNMLVIKYILDGTVIQKFLAFLENFWAISVDLLNVL